MNDEAAGSNMSKWSSDIGRVASEESSDVVGPLYPASRSNSYPQSSTGWNTSRTLASSSSTQSLGSCLAPCLEPQVSEATTSGRDETTGTGVQKRGIPFSKVINRLAKGVGAVLCFFGWRCGKIRLGDPEFTLSLIGGSLMGIHIVRVYHRKRALKFRRAKKFDRLVQNWSIQSGQRSESSRWKSDKKNLPWLPGLPDHKRTGSDHHRSYSVHFLNVACKTLWWAYSEAVCKQIEDSVTPLLEALKPAFIRHIRFTELTFGSIPFAITRVKCIEENSEEFVLEAGIRWHGENAAVALLVALRGGGTVVAKVEKLVFSGTAKVTFTPLVPYFPGFGALTVTFTDSPLVHFDVSVNGLQMVSDPIEKFLQSFIVEHIFGNLLVWPNRFVVPILSPEERGPIDHLYLRTKGMLRVVVKGAQGLTSMEGHQTGYRTNVHPFVTLETVPLQVFCTKVLPSSANPVWNEEHYLKVEELEQSLRVVLFDDNFGPGVVSGGASRGRKLGMCVIPLASLPVGEAVDQWFDLGKSCWEEELGPVRSKHHGPDILDETWVMPTSAKSEASQINLSLTYLPLDHLRRGLFPTLGSKKGAIHSGLLFVQLVRAFNVVSQVRKNLVSSYCMLRLGDTPPKKSRVVKDSVDPEWNENFEWFDACVRDVLEVEILHVGNFMDTSLGHVKISAESIALESMKATSSVVEATLELQGGLGDIQIQFDWVPLDDFPIVRKRSRKRDPGFSRLGPLLPRGQLMVRVLHARNLDGSDWAHGRGTYCVLKIQRKDQQSSLAKGTQQPSWLEVFSWESVKSSDVLDICVYCKGAMSDSFLGRSGLRIEDVAKEPDTVHLVNKPLYDRQIELPVGGILTLQILWTAVSHQQQPLEVPKWPEPRLH